MSDPVTQWIESPVGAVASALLDQDPLFSWISHRIPGRVSELTAAGLEGVLLHAAIVLNPWDPDAETERAACLRTAQERRQRAEALVRRWLPEMQRGISWPQWTFVFEDGQTGFDRDRFGTSEGMHRDYEDGQFPWGGAWSLSPTSAHVDLLLEAWTLDSDEQPVIEMHASMPARIAVVNGIEDWADLIRANPGRQTPTGLAPDWPAIAGRYDAVHLTWWGFVTTFANRETTDEYGVIPMEVWFGERTLWLNADTLSFGRRITLIAEG